MCGRSDPNELEAQTRSIERLVHLGYTAESVVKAVTTGDLSKLKTPPDFFNHPEISVCHD